MKIIPLSEGSFTIDQTKVFVPFNKEQDVLHHRPAGSLLVEVQPFVVVTEKDIILIDTGLGFSEPGGMPQLHRNLRNNGIEPASVTKILLSHLHKDHAGGIQVKTNDAAEPTLSFPNATYYVNKSELTYALEHTGKSYDQSQFSILANSNNLVLLEDHGTIDDYIQYEVSGAHSLYHTVFWITNGNEKIFYGGDVAPQLQQMKNRFVAKYDLDGRKSMELRSRWWEEGKAGHWTFLFYHDIKSPSIAL